ncbi:GDSL-type esterase/lipase family protein [Streptosporangium sp. NPDC049376]|uniref:GDSL-type esterase/lipase family protein n=1 Tax=Streptosporangium sp. NPDC049376 TaxID=3366192 RepID=UPI003794A059
MTLVLAGAVTPAQAGAPLRPSSCEGADRAAARLGGIGPAGVGQASAIRLMCAGEAPARLAALAEDADDVVMSFEVSQVDRGPLQAEVDKIHRAQATGQSLSDHMITLLKSYEVGVYPDAWEGVGFEGSIQVIDTGVAIVIPADQVGPNANWWQKFLSATVGTGAMILTSALCLGAFNVGAPAAAPFCGALGGFVGGMIGELLNAYFDNRPFTDPAVWTEALAVGIHGAITGAVLGKALAVMETGANPLLQKIAQGVKNLAAKFTAFRSPLEFVAQYLEGLAPALLANLHRLRNGIGSASLRPMALGSSSTYGEGSSDGNGYRDTADQGFNDLAERRAQPAGTEVSDDVTPWVDWVGSVRVGTMEDREVEGWRGYTIDLIAGKAQCAVKVFKPNVITLIAGGNDVLYDIQMDGAIGRLQRLVEQIAGDSPRAVVLVAGMQPLNSPKFPGANARGEAFTAQIPAMVDLLVKRGLRVVYTDTTGLELSDIGTDGIHPTDQGYEKIGTAFVKAAGQASDRGWLRPPAEQDPGQVSDACGGPRDDGTGTGDNSSKLGPNWEDRGVIQDQQYPNTSRFWMVDVNKDRKAEFVAVDEKQNFRFWWNSGPSGKNWMPFVEGQNSYKPAAGAVGNMLRFGDVDGDGFPDCMVVWLTGKVEVSTWKGDNPSGQRMCMNKYGGMASVFDEGSQGEILNIDPATKIRFADVTGGGRDDYLLIKPDGTTTAAYNRDFQNKDGRKWLDWTAPQQISGALANPREIRYADINGDKRADRILITLKGGARAWINEGAKGAGGTYRDIGRIAGDGDLPPKDIQFADIDGDGKADFLRIGWTGVTHAWLNKIPADYFDTFHP